MPIRILVIDDNRDTLKTYTKALLRRIKPNEWERVLSRIEEKPLEVEYADTISLALERLNTKPFDILVVDLKIPGLAGEEMGGLKLISESMSLDPLRPIISHYRIRQRGASQKNADPRGI